MRDFETILFSLEDGIATITLNRPDRMNSFTLPMALDLIAAFDETDSSDAVKAVIVTGAGERAFCAGADLSGGGGTFDLEERATLQQREASASVCPDSGGRVALRIFDSLKPVIGAVNGAAVGVGVTMLLPMDIRLASQDARFGFVFARRGIVPETASSWFLPRLVGIPAALDWCYSGRLFDASEALDKRLVQAIHPQVRLMAAARAVAQSYIADSAPVSIALTRQLIWRMMGADHPMEAHRLDSRCIMSRGMSADAREGITAFLEKRPAAFPDAVSTDMPDFFPWWPERRFE